MPPILKTLSRQQPYSGMLMLALVCGLIVVHLSLYPYSGWRHIGIGPLEYFDGPWVPAYQRLLWGDIALNIAAYVPLAFLLVMGLTRLPGHAERLLAPLLALTLSVGLEALQTWLPSRVPSKMDVLTNFIGAIIGTGLAIAVLKNGTWANRLNRTLNIWLTQRAWLGIGLICLWLVSLLAPRQPEFMLGVWLGNLFNLSKVSPDGSLMGLPDWFILASERWAPSIGNYCFLATILLIGLLQTRDQSPRIRLLLVLMAISLATSQLHHWFNGNLTAWLEAMWSLSIREAWAIAGALSLAIVLNLTKVRSSYLARLASVHLAVGWSLTLLLPGVYPVELKEGGFGLTRALRDLQPAGQWVGGLWPVFGLTLLALLAREKSEFRR